MPSFRRRLGPVHLSVIVVVLVLAALAAYRGLARAVHGQLDAALLVLAETEAGMLGDEQGGAVPVPMHLQAQAHEAAAASGVPLSFVQLDPLVQIVNAQGAPIARSTNLGAARLPAHAATMAQAAKGQTVFETLHEFGEEPIRLVTVPVRTGSSMRAVQVAGSLDGVHSALNAAAVLFAIMGAALLLAVGAALVQRAPKPAFEPATRASGWAIPSRAAAIGLVTALLSLHPLAVFLYLPTLPLQREAFGATAEATQWTLSAFVAGFGVTQLGWGMLADRRGRRSVLLLGLVCYLVAAIGCLLATDIWQLACWRALQGAGVAAAGVCARAMLRDLYRPSDAVRMLSIGFSWLSLVAVAAPIGGAAIVAARGAAGAFEVLAVIGAVVLFGVAWAVPETGAAVRSPRAPNATRESLRRIAGHPLFRAYTALTACTYAGHYLFLAGSSFLLIERDGLSVFAYGVVLAIGSLVHLAGTVACRHWLRRHSVRTTVGHAAVLTLLGGVAMAALALAGIGGPWALILPQWLYVFAHAVHQSCGQAAVMAPFPESAGTAAALSGTVLPLVAVAAASLLAGAIDPSPLMLPLGTAGCAALTAVVAWTLVQRHGMLDDE